MNITNLNGDIMLVFYPFNFKLVLPLLFLSPTIQNLFLIKAVH